MTKRALAYLLAGLFLFASGCDDSESPVDPGPPDPTGPTGVTIAAPGTVVPIIQTLELSATVQPAGENQAVTWSSSDEDIATVEDGVVTGIRIGTFTITATSVADPSLSDDLEMEVGGPLVCTDYEPLPLPTTATEDANILPGCYEYDSTRRIRAEVLIEGPAEIRSTAEGAGIRVDDDGELRAIGHPDLPVLFSSMDEEAGAWPGLRVTSDADNRFEHVVVEYAGNYTLSFHVGQYNTGLRLGSGSTIELDHVTIRETATDPDRFTAALFLQRGAVMEMTGESRFVENEGPPVHVTAPQIPMLSAEADYGEGAGENGINMVVVNDDATSSPPVVNESGTWPGINVAYHLVRTVTIEGSGTVVTVAPGARIEGTESAGIRVNDEGVLQSLGTEEDPVYFTAAAETPGAWPGLRISSDGDNRLEHTVVEYAGNYHLAFHGGSYATGIRLESTGNLTLEGATVRATDMDPDRFTAGLFLERGATLEMVGSSRFVENVGPPVHVTAPQMPMLSAEADYGGTEANGVNVVMVNDDATGSPPIVTEAGTWQAINVPFRLVRAVTIEGAEADIRVEPGARFEAMSGAGIRVDEGASLSSVGEEEEAGHIVFSGVEQTAGAWPGFHINTDREENEFRYTIIEHAGENSLSFHTVGGGGIETGIRVGDGVNEGIGGGAAAHLIFFDNIVRHVAGSGMRLEHSQTVVDPTAPIIPSANEFQSIGGPAVDDDR